LQIVERRIAARRVPAAATDADARCHAGARGRAGAVRCRSGMMERLRKSVAL
jgi:hypothetical protein